jgi:hypothetical protein
MANVLYINAPRILIHKALLPPPFSIIHQLMRLGPKFLVMNSLVYYAYTHTYSVRTSPKNLSLSPIYFRLFSSFVI